MGSPAWPFAAIGRDSAERRWPSAAYRYRVSTRVPRLRSTKIQRTTVESPAFTITMLPAPRPWFSTTYVVVSDAAMIAAAASVRNVVIT